jgi:hypothetical protein
MRSQNGLLLLLLAALIFVIPCQAVSTSTTLRAATTTTLANAPAQSTTVFCPSQGTYGPDFLLPFSYHEPKTNQKKIASFNCLRLSSPMRRLNQTYGAKVPLLIFNPDNKCFIVRMPRIICLSPRCEPQNTYFRKILTALSVAYYQGYGIKKGISGACF